MPPPTPRTPPLGSRERELAGQVEDALLHFEIGQRTWNARLFVDWQHVATQMAACLAAWEEVDGVEVMVLPGWPAEPDGEREAS
jgi:hypothetical protein